MGSLKTPRRRSSSRTLTPLPATAVTAVTAETGKKSQAHPICRVASPRMRCILPDGRFPTHQISSPKPQTPNVKHQISNLKHQARNIELSIAESDFAAPLASPAPGTGKTRVQRDGDSLKTVPTGAIQCHDRRIAQEYENARLLGLAPRIYDFAPLRGLGSAVVSAICGPSEAPKSDAQGPHAATGPSACNGAAFRSRRRRGQRPVPNKRRSRDSGIDPNGVVQIEATTMSIAA